MSVNGIGNYSIINQVTLQGRDVNKKLEEQDSSLKFQNTTNNETSINTQKEVLKSLGIQIAETPFDKGFHLKYAEGTLEPYYEQELEDGTKNFVRIAKDENGNTNIISTQLKAGATSGTTIINTLESNDDKSVGDKISDFFAGAGEFVGDKVDTAIETGIKVAETIGEYVVDTVKNHAEYIENTIENVAGFVENTKENAIEFVETAKENNVEYAENTKENINEFLENPSVGSAVEFIFEQAGDTVSYVGSQSGNAVNTVWKQTKDIATGAWNGVKNKANAVIKQTKNTFSFIGNSVKNGWNAITGLFK